VVFTGGYDATIRNLNPKIFLSKDLQAANAMVEPYSGLGARAARPFREVARGEWLD